MSSETCRVAVEASVVLIFMGAHVSVVVVLSVLRSIVESAMVGGYVCFSKIPSLRSVVGLIDGMPLVHQNRQA